ncbi:MAG: hypothetical protein ACYS76_08085 [Planctomycetota bacterium]|jgi:hypothetical protein
MGRKIVFRALATAAVVLLATAVYYRDSWIPVVYKSFAAWYRKEAPEPTFEQQREKRRAYYQSLREPQLAIEELIAQMKREKGLRDLEVRRAVEWYLCDPNSKISVEVARTGDANSADIAQKVNMYYNDQKQLIRQLVENLHFEVEVTLPEETKYGPTNRVDNGWSYEILLNRYSLLRGINEVLYEKLHEYSVTAADPRFIHLLLDLKRRRSKESSDNRGIRYKDMMAFLRIYAKYKDWSSIRERVKGDILHYPGEWGDYHAIQQILEIADTKGAPAASQLYLKRYKGNYHHSLYYAHDPESVNKMYVGHHTFEGWPGERQVKGTIRFYNVDSKNVCIKLRNAEKVHSVLRNGVDISSLCSTKPSDIVLIPLDAAELVEIEYSISVKPEWWESYD